jgi:hypothetical protein
MNMNMNMTNKTINKIKSTNITQTIYTHTHKYERQTSETSETSETSAAALTVNRQPPIANRQPQSANHNSPTHEQQYEYEHSHLGTGTIRLFLLLVILNVDLFIYARGQKLVVKIES